MLQAVALGLALLAPLGAVAAPAAEIARVEAYLSSISSLVADFEQVDAAGNLAHGKFFLRRPGKMRWQYAPPTPLLIVSDGKVITYYDAELDQISYLGVDDSLAGFLAAKTIALDSKTVELTDFASAHGVVRATLRQRAKPADGSLMLEFSDDPLTLRQLIVTDAAGSATHIRLDNLRFGQNIPDGLFRFDDPRGVNKRRNRQ